MYKFKFADVGEGLHEGTVTKIYVKKGDVIKEGDDLFTVETEKVTTEITSPTNGRIHEILTKEGGIIHVGDVVIVIDDGTKLDKEEGFEIKQAIACPIRRDAASVVGEVKVSNEKLSNIFSSNNKEQKKFEEKEPSIKLHHKEPPKIKKGDSILTTPLVRHLAKDLHVDINLVKGSGPQGRILAKDVESYAKLNKDGKLIDPTINKEERVKVTSLRQTIASVLKNSWNQVAYINLAIEVDVSRLFVYRKKIKEYTKEKYNINVTFLSFVLKAFSLALKDYPILNAIYDEKNNELVLKKYYNIGIAVDTPQGLLVPIIKNVDSKSILEISREIIHLGKKARENKLTHFDVSGGTFSVTNYGSVGCSFGVPVIKYPELAICGMGNIFDRAVILGEKVFNRKLMYLTIAADHRWIDGATIGRCAKQVKLLLEQPELLCIH